MPIVVLILASMLLVACNAASEAGPSRQPSVRASVIPAPTSATPATHAPTGPAAAETGATYRLECGPLEPGPCAESAARLVKRVGERYPSRTVVTIDYTTPCGSFQLQFDDGTGIGADVDCILPSPPG